MWWLSSVGFGIIAIYVVGVIQYFCTIRRTAVYLLVALFCAVYIPFSIILLVPIDLASSTSDSQPLLSLPRPVTFAIWRVVYWLAFALTWFILPVLQGYMESGNYDKSKRLRDAIKGSARHQLIMLVIGSFCLIYFLVYAGLSFMSLKALAIALSHSYSLIAAMWLMGIGIVQIPRSLLMLASPDSILATLEERAPNVHDNLLEWEGRFKDVASEIRSLESIKEGPFENWINDLLDEIPAATIASQTMTRSQVSETYLVPITYRMRKAKTNYARYQHEWHSLVRQASYLMDIIDADTSHSLHFSITKSKLSPKLAYIFFNILRPFIFKLLGVLASIFSIVLVWSEVSQGTHASLLGFISLFTFGFMQELLSFTVIAYMCFAAYHSLARVKIFNIYSLSAKHTDPSSAIFYSSQACRLTIPLSYSYVSMVPHIPGSISVFEEFLQKSINLTPLGRYFIIWLPRFILIPVLISYFNFYDRLQHRLGFGQEFGEDDNQVGNRVEGRDLIKFELTYNLPELVQH